MTFLDLSSVRKCYGIKTDVNLHTAKVQHEDGPEFKLHHLEPILLYNPELG